LRLFVLLGACVAIGSAAAVAVVIQDESADSEPRTSDATAPEPGAAVRERSRQRVSSTEPRGPVEAEVEVGVASTPAGLPAELERRFVAAKAQLAAAKTDEERTSAIEALRAVVREIASRRRPPANLRPPPRSRHRSGATGRGMPETLRQRKEEERRRQEVILTGDLSGFTDPDPKGRLAAISRAPAIEARHTRLGPSVIAALAGALTDEDPRVRIAACRALRKIHTGGETPIDAALLALVRAADDPDGHVRDAAQAFLIDSGLAPRETAEFVLRYAADGTSADRMRALNAIAGLGLSFDTVMDVLRRSLNDADPKIRAATIGALRELGEPAQELLPMIRALCRDGVEAVRLQAALFVAASGDVNSETIDLIASFAESTSNPLRVRVFEGLVVDPDPAFADILARAIGRYEGPVAARGLVSMGAPGLAALNRLLASTRDRKQRVKLVNAISLFGSDAEWVLDSVRKADSDKLVRYAAQSALLRIRREKSE